MVTTNTYVKSNRTRDTGSRLTMLSCPVTSARNMAEVSAAAAAAAAAVAAEKSKVGYYAPSMAYYDIPALTLNPAAASVQNKN